MPQYERDRARLMDLKTGAEIMPGDTVTTFQGEKTVFRFVSRLPEPGKTGKIITDIRPGGEFYPLVVGARIETRNTLDMQADSAGGGRTYPRTGYQVYDETGTREDHTGEPIGPVHIEYDAAEKCAEESGAQVWSIYRVTRRVGWGLKVEYDPATSPRATSW